MYGLGYLTEALFNELGHSRYNGTPSEEKRQATLQQDAFNK
jgi:hypothetical protein